MQTNQTYILTLINSLPHSEFDCPVCFEEMRPPRKIYQCGQGHVVCEVRIMVHHVANVARLRIMYEEVQDFLSSYPLPPQLAPIKNKEEGGHSLSIA